MDGAQFFKMTIKINKDLIDFFPLKLNSKRMSEILEKISNDQICKHRTKKLMRTLELNLKEEASENKSALVKRISEIVVQDYPNLKGKILNGLNFDYDWKELFRADPNVFIWFGLIICLFAFSLGWYLSKKHQLKHSKILLQPSPILTKDE